MKKKLMKIQLLVTALIGLNLSTVSLAHQTASAWSYDGSTGVGAKQWQKQYPECAKGTQSPINIPSNIKPDPKLPSLEFVFTPSPVKVVDTGHAIQANILNQSDTLTVSSTEYYLQQFHIHIPSENAVKGQNYPAEIQLVYKDKQGKYAVVGIFVKQGASNGTLAGIIKDVQKHNQPQKPLVPKAATKNKKAAPAKPQPPIVNANDLLPSDSNSYYGFQGSLTVPPCTHDIQWYLLPDPITASASEIQALKKLYHGNARPEQALNGRTIVYKPPVKPSTSK